MMHKTVLVLILLVLSGILVSAQSMDDEGNPNNPNDNDRANACYEGASMEGKCDGIWEWTCGWYLIRFEAGIILREDFPTQCSILLPPLAEEEVVVVSGPPRMTAGCYDSTGGDLDFIFSGNINQINNATVNTSNDGSCTGFVFNAMIVYFVGSQADALAFCQSINPAVSSIENSQAKGYPVPNGYFWGCV